MKSIPLRLIIATTLIIGVLYAISHIASKEMLTLATMITAWMLCKFIIRTTLYIIFKVLKWAFILAVIGLLLASLI